MIFLDEKQHKQVSSAVAAAELKSSGEIVTITTQQSDSYSDIALVWAAIVSFALITILIFIPEPVLHWYGALHGEWNAEWLPYEVFAIAAGIGILSFLLVWLAQLWTPLRFALVPGRVKDARVQDRAIDLFKVGAEKRTQGRTGILIYLSMSERRAEILADEAIASKVDAEVWGDAMNAMLAELKNGRLAEGMVAAIDRVGDILARHFPRADDDENELPDRLIEL
ncbi:hypothetical protein D6851_01335 [Altericroceibacterium spongiae]|uniref:TPM domain-containing protein n=1 Tax=Altericroceibacterium spongiae TaxID=2320269 RepID=A0A420ER48_9SPHN|nr:TPM domain-containing protein [Altericroceibacterium spongiae]RKF23164.1 hypothetical protein D6851_01335 [Altericroceibacterium spongiae]